MYGSVVSIADTITDIVRQAIAVANIDIVVVVVIAKVVGLIIGRRGRGRCGVIVTFST